ncbi:MAG TPA: ATP-binding cassette domain-containing protein [Dokdonella sp.]
MIDTATPLGAEAATPLIELDRATVCRGIEPVLREVSLRIDAGRHTAILGPNGCGKSTFVKLINRELYPVARAGEPAVRVLGQTRWDVFALREQLGLVAPDLQRDLLMAPGLIAEDAVVCGYFASQRLPPYREVTLGMRERARAALADADAAHLTQRPLASLSTGEARRVLIARALVHRPRALLLDEPTTGLDIAAQQRFLATLRRLAQAGTTLVLVTHHVEEIVAEIERVVLLRDGRVFADGTPAQVLTAGRMSALYGIPLDVERTADGYRLLTATPVPSFSAATAD